MKRIVCLLIVLLLIPVISLADLPDISDLSSDELLALNHQIQLRLFTEKLLSGVDVPAGDYIVGEDIPAGVYRLEVLYPDSGGYLRASISQTDKNYVIDSFLGEFWGVKEIGKVEFKDGNLISIHGNALRFLPYTGLFN